MSFDVISMLVSFGASLDPIERLVTGVAYVMGVYFFYKSAMTFKIYGQMRMFTPVRGNSMGGAAFLFTGVMFLYLPTAIESFLRSIYGNESILAYDEWSVDLLHQYGEFSYVVLGILKVAGLLWFIKGFTIVAYSGKDGRGTAKGVWYIVGGILAINFMGTVNMLSNTVQNTLG